MKKYGWITILSVFILASVALADDEYDETNNEGQIEENEKTFQVSAQKPLTVQLEVTAGEIELINGNQATQIRIALEYSKNRYRSTIDMNEKDNHLRVKLIKRDWHHFHKSDGEHGDDWAKATIELPTGVDLFIESRLKAGQANMQLGGLRIKEMEVGEWAGELELDFDSPNLIPMDYLEINPKIGQANLRNLGNARYKEAVINGGIGELTVDFSGAVEADSRAKVDIDIGEATVILPDSIGTRVAIGGGLSFLSQKQIEGSFSKRGRFYYSKGYDTQKRRCTFYITPGLGELRVEMGDQ